MQRFSKFVDLRRADFWREYYSNPELLSITAYINTILAAKAQGYKLLNTYDVSATRDCTPGLTKIWEDANLYFAADTGYANSYRYLYGVDKGWVSVESLASSIVDPTSYLVHGKDFVYNNGIIRSKVLLSDIKYIAKGQYTHTSIADYTGTAMGYAQKDSFKYRDNLEVFSRLMYVGPTLPNITAAMNVAMGGPVSKSNESVLSTFNNEILTNKNKYILADELTSVVKPGDVLTEGTPLCGVLDVFTNKNSPGWWKTRVPTLFQKYAPDSILTYETVNLLMETFLKTFVANVRINLKYIDNEELTKVLNSPMWQLMLEGSAIRSDYLISTYGINEDTVIPDVSDTTVKVSVGGNCVWGTKEVASEAWLHAPTLVNPYIFDDDVTSPYWSVGSHRWHILDLDERVHEFWSAKDTVMPYLEPTHDYWHFETHTAEEGTSLPKQIIKATISALDDSQFRPFDAFYVLGIDPDNSESDPGRVITNVTDSIKEMSDNGTQALDQPSTYLVGASNSGTLINSIYGDLNIGHSELANWKLSSEVSLGSNGIGVHTGQSGYAESDAIFIGGVPKTAIVTMGSSIPVNTSLSCSYSLDGISWITLPAGGAIHGAYNYLYLRVQLAASATSYPVLKGFDISVRL